MSNINKQTQDLYSIELVQDLDHEAAATVSGGALLLSNYPTNTGEKLTVKGKSYSFGKYNNKASWYEVKGDKDWYAYSDKNFKGKRYLLKAGTKANLKNDANNNWESAQPVPQEYSYY
ncbi:hypothetical protein [Nostoc sp. DedQUE09]|uniref:hypothetical protein n=1 Tax=Nostoc sp. DedQUE09 TaxID=3075394 RepID=UPI002AD39431|nr:hypothetical protein [Nostoc sp. DedQUE09]MDZ7955801.1 hypothetical protein [Nostoc sp. DedQUE09]